MAQLLAMNVRQLAIECLWLAVSAQARTTIIYKTKSQKAVHIGERRKPINNGLPGYIRIDTVHQGDLEGSKGVYHINAVDEVTQFEVVASVEKINNTTPKPTATH